MVGKATAMSKLMSSFALRQNLGFFISRQRALSSEKRGRESARELSSQLLIPKAESFQVGQTKFKVGLKLQLHPRKSFRITFIALELELTFDGKPTLAAFSQSEIWRSHGKMFARCSGRHLKGHHQA